MKLEQGFKNSVHFQFAIYWQIMKIPKSTVTQWYIFLFVLVPLILQVKLIVIDFLLECGWGHPFKYLVHLLSVFFFPKFFLFSCSRIICMRGNAVLWTHLKSVILSISFVEVYLHTNTYILIKCTHFKCPVQWVFTNVYTHVTMV